MNDGRKENGWWNMETMIRLKANGFVHIGWTYSSWIEIHGYAPKQLSNESDIPESVNNDEIDE